MFLRRGQGAYAVTHQAARSLRIHQNVEGRKKEICVPEIAALVARVTQAARAYAHARIAGGTVGRQLIDHITHGSLRGLVALYLDPTLLPEFPPGRALGLQSGAEAPVRADVQPREGVYIAARADACTDFYGRWAAAAHEAQVQAFLRGLVGGEFEPLGADPQLHIQAKARVQGAEGRCKPFRASGVGDEAGHAQSLAVLLHLVVRDGAVARRAVYAGAQAEARAFRELHALEEPAGRAIEKKRRSYTSAEPPGPCAA